MRVSQASISFRAATPIPLGATRTWRSAIAIAVGLVVTSAAVARDRLSATAAIPDRAAMRRMAPVVALPIRQAVPGITRPSEETTIALAEPGVIQQVVVAVGDRVRTGQVLLTLEHEEGRSEIERWRAASEDAKDETVQLRRTIELLDRAIAAAADANAHAAAELAATERLVQHVPNRVRNSLESAQATYDGAVARERRAAALAAHGVAAREELEQAQMAVRAAADNLETARRAADAEATLAAVRALRDRTQKESGLADVQRQRDQRLAELIQAERRRRAAETALKKSVARVGRVAVRALRDGVVAAVLVRAGDQVRAGSPVLRLAKT